jgi:uncharacterized protein YfbU (UPF0304 family)
MESEIKLSPGEKLILLMLCDIQKHLKMKGDTDTTLIQEAITSGNLWGLNIGLPGVFHGYETPKTVVEETASILQMWERLEESYNALSQEEKDKLADKPGMFGKTVTFLGFGENFESEYISAMKFYVNHLDSFQHFKGRTNLNAHIPTLDMYRRMLLVFEPILNQVLNLNFTSEQIAQVIAEAVHPENRK